MKLQKMKKLMKICSIILLMVMTFCVASCNMNVQTEKKHTYVVNYYLEENSLYASYRISDGNKVKMPNDPVKEGMKFLYWETLENEKISSETIVESNLDIYAKWQNTEKEDAYEKILAKYKTYQYQVIINGVTETYGFDGITYKKTLNDDCEILTNINGVNYYFGNADDKEKYYFIKETEEEYSEKYNSFLMLDLSSLSSKDYIFDSEANTFEYQNLEKYDAASNVFKGKMEDLLENYTFTIKVNFEKNTLESIIINAKTKVEIVIVSSSQAKIDVPNLMKPLNEITVAAVNTADLQSEVHIRGYYIGSIQGIAYLADYRNIVVAKIDENDIKDVTMCTVLDVKGTTKLIDDEIVLTDVTIIEKATSPIIEITQNIKKIEDVFKRREIVNMESALVETVPTKFVDGTNNIVVVLNGIKLIVVIDKAFQAEYSSKFEGTLKKGDKLNINDVIFDVEKYQLIVTSLSSLVKSNLEKDTSLETIYDVSKRMNEYAGTVYGLPHGMNAATGTGKALVIPVAFSDKKAPVGMKETLEKAFFGTSQDTGWESLTSYYYKSSYGKFTISGTVLEPFNTGQKMSYYENLYDKNGDPDYEIIKAALTYYDSKIDYSIYDSDGDGYIDALYLVYTAPVSYGTSTNESELWWAYTYEYYTDDYEYYDGVEANTFCFMGYDFFDEAFIYGASEEDDVYVKINTTTLIHETGHVLGLDDYYDNDTSTGPAGGVGGCDMMDSNVGDQTPYSKLILGWVAPYIVNKESTTITLEAFNKTGDCIVIPYKWNGSIFTEFLVLDFYTPDGLNEEHVGYKGLFTKSGIRVYHVDATLKDPKDATAIYDMTLYNNSTSSHKLITIYEADGRGDITNTKDSAYGNYTTDSDLFYQGSVLKNGKWYDGTSMGFSVKIDLITNSSATITITFE